MIDTSREPELTILVLAGGNFEGKTLGPAPPQCSHPLLLPAGNGLAIEIIRQFYEKTKINSIFKVCIDDPQPRNIPIRCIKAEDLIQISPQRHILGSLRKALEAVETPWVIVNPITTLPSGSPQLANQIMVGEHQIIRENWSAVQTKADGSYTFESKKEASKSTLSAPFTGILCAERTLLTDLVYSLPENQSDDLIYAAKALVERSQASVISTQWHDLGHRATHAISRRDNFSSREFNNVRHCHTRDVIIKTSKDQTRLTAEREYLKKLPQTLRRHFPSLIPSQAEEKSALVMEAIPFPSLAELHLHWDIGPNIWLGILDRLKSIQTDFVNTTPAKIGSSSWLYSEKLATRWKQFKKSYKKDLFWDRELCINGQWYPSLENQVGRLITALQPLERNSSLHLIHGDFCFNNILCDPLYTAIRLIDPRGEAAPGNKLPPGYGDNRYDLVKLYHSISGHYDSIVNNMFKVQWHDSAHVEIEIYVPNHQPFLEEGFHAKLKPPELSNHELCILTASLFFSMLPLHQEDPERQLAFAKSGLTLLEKGGI